MFHLSGRKLFMITVNCIGLGHWGPNLVRCFDSSQRATVGTVCDLSDTRLALLRKRYLPTIRTSTDPLRHGDRSGGRCRRDRHADAHALRPGQGGARSGQARAGRKATGRQRSTMPKRWSNSPNEHDRLLAVGHVFLVQQRHSGREAADRPRRSGARPLHLFHAHEPGPVPHRLQRPVGSGAHDISIFNYWLDADPQQATACGTSCSRRASKTWSWRTSSIPTKVQACVLASWLNPQKVREITVVGERQMVVWNDMDLDEPVRIYTSRSTSNANRAMPTTRVRHRMLVRSGDVIIPKIEPARRSTAECQHFLDCLEGKARRSTTARSACEVVRALAAAEQSLHQGSRADERPDGRHVSGSSRERLSAC